VTTDETLYHGWTIYIWAREEARRCGDRRVGTEHLLLALLHDPGTVAVLSVSLEQCRQALDSLDREALESLGVTASLEAPPLAMRGLPARPTLRAVLKDRLPMTPAAKQALERAARPARQGKHRVDPQEVLLRLLDLKRPDPVADLIVELNIDADAVRARMRGA
jgi:ATP-dependent Clp protease ATP-binding subunit ClpA